ncbi:hypothetical protein MKW94_023163 [Papaver nudicaule]|uniref:UBC core domain-containing protein n=1 Tax=Papaver nudicaule TaxID=74823 RepID=A0AA41RRE9_PAPNU|nr:hypothetical protein [Papaver nudicaule]
MEVRNNVRNHNGIETTTTTTSPVHQHPLPSPNKQIKPSHKPVDTNSVTLRLQKELMSLMMNGGSLGVSAFPENENIFSWLGLSYKLSLRFPLDYPFKAPLVKFDTMCFHPNVDQYGNICLDILQDKWSSAYDCRTILISIQSMLGESNNESPLNSYAASLWHNQEYYKKMVRKQFMDETEFES